MEPLVKMKYMRTRFIMETILFDNNKSSLRSVDYFILIRIFFFKERYKGKRNCTTRKRVVSCTARMQKIAQKLKRLR